MREQGHVENVAMDLNGGLWRAGYKGMVSCTCMRSPRTASLTEERFMGTLSIIDLAGSERAAATTNMGQRMVEGASINKSLLERRCVGSGRKLHRKNEPHGREPPWGGAVRGGDVKRREEVHGSANYMR